MAITLISVEKKDHLAHFDIGNGKQMTFHISDEQEAQLIAFQPTSDGAPTPNISKHIR